MKLTNKLFILTGVVSWFIGPDLFAADWYMYRGGSALRGATTEQLPEKLGLHWEVKTGGPIRQAASIMGGRVYIGSGDGLVRSLKLESGEQVWQHKIKSPLVDRLREKLKGAPPGGLIPKTNLIQMQMQPSQALVLDGVVVFSIVEAIYGLDAKTGELLWTYSAPHKVGGLNHFRTPKGQFVLASSANRTVAIELKTGKAVWGKKIGLARNGAAPSILDFNLVTPNLRTVNVYGFEKGAELMSLDLRKVLNNPRAFSSGPIPLEKGRLYVPYINGDA